MPLCTGGHFVACAELRVGLPLVGAKVFQATNGSIDPEGYISHEVTAPRAAGRQAAALNCCAVP
jgi:hypothetical protein